MGLVAAGLIGGYVTVLDRLWTRRLAAGVWPGLRLEGHRCNGR